jgi:hypothetical protein
MTEDEFLDTLKSVATGIQDDSYKRRVKEEDKSEYVETRTYTFPAGHTIYKFEKDDAENNYGYKNLRIVSDIANVEKMTLSIGAAVFDETRPYVLKEEYPFACFQQCVIPALQFQHSKIITTCSEPTTISYDVHKFEPYYHRTAHEYWINCYDDRSVTMKMKGCAHIELDFNHPTTDIWVDTDAPSAKNMYLEFMNKSDCRVRLHKVGDLWHCDLKGLNLSRVDDVDLHYDTEGEKHTTTVYAKNLNCIRIMHGMAGLAYARH